MVKFISIAHMSVERSWNNLDQIENKSLKPILKSVDSWYNLVSTRIFSNQEQAKEVNFNWETFKDSSNKLHIPLNSEFKIPTEHNGKYSHIYTNYIWILEPRSMFSNELQFKVYKWSMNQIEKDENILAEILFSDDSPSISKKEGLNSKEFKTLMKSTDLYLKSYFSELDQKKVVEQIEQIHIQEFLDKWEEGDIEDLLDELQSL